MLTLAFQAFGLCHVIQFPLRPSAFCGLSLRSRSALASPIRLADPPRRIASGFSPTLPWGKNPARRGAREEARAQGVPVADTYRVWDALAAAGVDTTEMLANSINHPSREAHRLFVNEILRVLLEV